LKRKVDKNEKNNYFCGLDYCGVYACFPHYFIKKTQKNLIGNIK